MRAAVRNEIEKAHGRGLSEEQLDDLADRALTWRMVDLVDPSRLGDDQANLARHGVEQPMWPEGGGAHPLPSERLVVAKTLTWAEAKQYRPFAELRMNENPALKHRKGRKDQGFGLLYVTTLVVAYERLKTPPNKLEVPLQQSQLDLAAALLSGGS